MSGSSSAMQNKDKQENDDDDESFLQEYRKARKAQLRQRASLPQFGTLLTVSPVQFLDKVDGAHAHAYVVFVCMTTRCIHVASWMPRAQN